MRISVTGRGSRENGGWIHLEDKEVRFDFGASGRGAARLGILLMWDEEMDETGLEEYVADHLSATGEFPDASELPLCRGCVQVFTAYPDSMGEEEIEAAPSLEHELNFEFDDAEGMVAAYAEARRIWDSCADFRAFVSERNRRRPRIPTRAIAARLLGGKFGVDDLDDFFRGL